MKNKLIKIFYLYVVITVVFFSSSLLTQNTKLEPISKACATDWGACNPDPNYQSCPSGIGPISGCVKSVDFKITIQSDTPIPLGQNFRVDIFPTDGSQTCPDVTCLKRVSGYTTTSGWNGSSMILPTLDQIGCSSGVCPNNFSVRVRFAAPYQQGIPNCPDSMNPDVLVSGVQNGFPKDVPVTIHCQAPPVTTCQEVGGSICGPTSLDKTSCGPGQIYTWVPGTGGTSPGPGDPYCQQQSGNYICYKCVSCPVPPAPQPTITCNGCQ